MVVDIKQHKSQFNNSNFAITQSAKFFRQPCCKDDQPFQWETPKFDPSYFPNPLNPSLLSLNSTFHQYFIYLIVCKVNLKLVLSWNTGYFA